MCVWFLEYVLCCSSGYVETQFMDPDFNHQKWSSKLQVVLLPMLPMLSCQTAGGYLNFQSSGLQLFRCLAGVHQ